MPIHGLTDTPEAFIKIGAIKKGDRGGKNGAPRDLDYFRILFKENDISKLVEARFLETYGKEPRSINVRFAASEPSEVWDANLECYRAGGLIAKVGSNENGPYWIYYRDPDSLKVLVRGKSPTCSEGRDFMAQPIDLEAPIYYTKSKNEPEYLHPKGRLQCVVPELTRVMTDEGPRVVVGFMEFAPQSPIDIRNISAELGMYHKLAKAAGRTINGIPFQLIRLQEEHTVKIDGAMVKKKMWVVHLDCKGDWGRMALEVVERLALPEVIDYTDVVEVDQEFEPESTPQPQPKPKNEPEPAMSLKEAQQTVIVHVNDKGKNVERFVSELKDNQLQWVITNHQDPTSVLAAKIVLADRKVVKV